jgi:Rps23 Pro-64 3,4-dihydroxylase Tpa1-like proline 4-hydroxylase
MSNVFTQPNLTRFDREKFSSAKPFPHIIIDDFFNESEMKSIVEDCHRFKEFKWWMYDNIFEKKLACNNLDNLGDNFRKYFNLVNSREFVLSLEKMTGFKGLIADPSLYGGGLHRIDKGGKLDIHADFNYHKITGWRRRLNLITYLNEDWLEEYGGHTEFWNRNMTKCVQSILPKFNRAAVFEVDDYTWHGHPDPLECPKERQRLSLATYYYTHHNDNLYELEYHSTDYQSRPTDKKNKEIESLREKRRKGRLEDLMA